MTDYGDMCKDLREMRREIAEQARLLGIGGTRESALMAKVDAITRERDEALALNAKWAEKAETWTVSPEAAQRLRRYRDLAQQVAEVQNKRDEALVSVDTLRAAIKTAEAALADIGDSDHEPSDDLAWCERRAQQALPVVRFALAATEAKP